jgi:16S rRNA (cytidine1402-2'-O)-methyltransferase
LRATLSDIGTELGSRVLFMGRELTKLHQEMLRGTAQDLVTRFEGEAPRGEITLVVAGARENPERTAEALDELRERRDRGEDRRTVLADIAARFGVRRQELYRHWHDETPPREGAESS